MRVLFFIAALLWAGSSYAQSEPDTTVNLDLLKSPISPAFTILGIATSDVERPTDPTAFAVSVQQATNNFTALPNSYALQLAPFLWGRKKFTLSEYDGNTHAFRQSFLISAGFTYKGPEGKENIDSLKTTRVGAGINFSLLRPKWTTETRATYQKLIEAQRQVLADYREMEGQNKLYRQIAALKKERKELNDKENKTQADLDRIEAIKEERQRLEAELGEELNASLAISSAAYAQAKKAATSFKSERQGPFIDLSAGFALDFPGNRFNNSRIYRGGAWLTGGYENGNKGITSLFIVRYLYNPEKVFADPDNLLPVQEQYSTLDAGARFLLSSFGGKLMLSGEALYRSVAGTRLIDPSWRLVVNAAYDVGINRKLTFSFGRNFDGVISKGGNLLAALNLVLGFGTDRPAR